MSAAFTAAVHRLLADEGWTRADNHPDAAQRGWYPPEFEGCDELVMRTKDAACAELDDELPAEGGKPVLA